MGTLGCSMEVQSSAPSTSTLLAVCVCTDVCADRRVMMAVCKLCALSMTVSLTATAGHA